MSMRNVVGGVPDEKCRVTRFKVSFKWRVGR
jgi:hypothetical protein